MSNKIKTVYNLKTGKVGCVLIQAGHACPTDVAARVFNPDDWEVAPTEGQAVMEATLDQWKFIANMSIEDRVQRFLSSV